METETAATTTSDAFSHFSAAIGGLGLLYYAFVLWMAIHAIRERSWLWLVVLIAMPGFAFWYFLYEYRSNPMTGFELPGAADRRRAKALEAQIALAAFERPDLLRELGELRLKQGKLAEAERRLAAAVKLKPTDTDAQALFGQVLLRSGRPEAALPHLEYATRADQRHNYGHTMMARAEALAALNRRAEAVTAWRKVLEANHYDRAKTQLAELLAEAGQTAEAATLAREVLRTAPHASFARRRHDRVWHKRARKLLAKLP